MRKGEFRRGEGEMEMAGRFFASGGAKVRRMVGHAKVRGSNGGSG